ncbi:MAG TPA: hypothetical protein DIT75_04360 [Rikenellaceae bacterium]|nr:hypothetical protein [Rikenellaceae bacterium]
MKKAFLKRIVSIASAIWLALLACGCNQDAFVNQLSPSIRDISLPEDGDSIKVRFKTGDWRVYSIRVNGGHSWHPGLSSEMTEIDDGKMKLSDNGFTMFYKKSSARELAMFFQPNFSDSDLKVDVVIASSFEYDTLTVTQPRSSGYDLERIEWNEPVTRTFPEYEKGWGPLSYKNEGPDTLRVNMRVFFGAARQVKFSDDSGFGLYCGDFRVPVPDGALNDETLCFSKQDSVIYSYDTKEYPLVDDREIIMKFPPTGKFSLYYNVLWNIDTYSTGYNLSLRNKATGKIVEIKGKFSSMSPNGAFSLYTEKR